MKTNTLFWPPNAFRFMGGGGGGGAPVLPAPPPPPASATSVEVTQAKLAAKRNAKNKMGLDQTIMAGAGQAPESTLGANGSGKSTLLGGG